MKTHSTETTTYRIDADGGEPFTVIVEIANKKLIIRAESEAEREETTKLEIDAKASYATDLDRLPAYLDTHDVPAVLAWISNEMETFGLGDRSQSPPVWMLRLDRALRGLPNKSTEKVKQ